MFSMIAMGNWNYFFFFFCTQELHVKIKIPLLQIVDDGDGELVGGVVSAQILGADLASLQYTIDSIDDHIAIMMQVDVS